MATEKGIFLIIDVVLGDFNDGIMWSISILNPREIGKLLVTSHNRGLHIACFMLSST